MAVGGRFAYLRLVRRDRELIVALDGEPFNSRDLPQQQRMDK